MRPLLVLAAAAGMGLPALGADEPTFRIEFRDGVITPLTLEVPADMRFRIELSNVGTTPVEFESVELRKEKVLGPGNETVMVIRRLAPGSYDFFDDFHLDMPHAVLVAR
ncbi:MAG: hypothetical protein ABS35_20020 [Kaistia sp. SCN 65-12]|jgi:hypothetical protein|nr:MAG: hypothetical protein ABS35_20020 [Kaistia sp. SCN 65-12]